MRFASLFTGVGGFDLGLERAGMECIAQAEIDPYRSLVLRTHWPGVPNHGDVRTIDPAKLAEAELIAGGFPCTDLSFAGRGAGITGKHSGLWREFHRIVRAVRPRWVVVENVPGIRSRGLGVVLGQLAEIGYDAEWDCVPASAVGAHHHRDRFWLVAYPGRERLQRQREPGDVGSPARADEGEGLQLQRGRDAARTGGAAAVADPESEPGRAGHGAAVAPRLGWRRLVYGGQRLGGWDAEPGVGRVADGIPYRLDRISALGDSLVPQIAQAIGVEILRAEKEVGR